MTVYNTPSDAANTAVRSFLTSVGQHYLGKAFNTGTGSGKATWAQICDDFGGMCAYCGTLAPMQIEHLVMFNRTEYGLHHPGNVVPVCKPCNKRAKDANNQFVSWEAHLAHVCGGSDSGEYMSRYARILGHIAKYNYPALTDHERHAIRVIAEALYENIKTESEKALSMYRKLDAAFVQPPKTLEEAKS
ncbi:HNH endonuclease [Lysobacter sp. A6]|uniref:HNH endonuclease n=1 Tax=Noviluteimonas lactosilytica TaxID=2888523 RepID=A0ABS8JJ31_9GAMM|nr:HNH endonuclease signature motif containing protein [Lysobacter lactosilyticus]MCC8363618.1 HNH endonuclease [Lysobacter lactosilyticus]